MKRIYLLLLSLLLFISLLPAQVKILFDATKAETAANADWVIDSDLFNLGFPASNGGAATVGAGNESNPQRIPSPSVVPGQTYAESYWKGSLSYWGLDCVQKGYTVETLSVGASITYGNASNVQDLGNYKVFIVCEPNIQFSASEKTAILSFVQNGGGLFMVSDHDVSDRNNDGWDSPQIWDDLMQVNSTGNTNPFGMIFNRSSTAASDNFSETSTNLNQSLAANDPILHGPMGAVAKIKWTNGTSMTLNPASNSSVKAVFYRSTVAVPPSGNNLVMVAYATYGTGKVVAIGDSSPCDDGTGDPNDNLYTGYMGDVPPNHRNLLMNATIWLATPSGGPIPVNLVSFSAISKASSVMLEWKAMNEQDLAGYQVQRSADGIHFENIGSLIPAYDQPGEQHYAYTDDYPILDNTENYYRIRMIDRDGRYLLSEQRKVQFSKYFFEATLVQNPVENNIRVSINSLTAGNMRCTITSTAGQVIGYREMNIHKGIQQVTLPVYNLTPGFYMLTLLNDLKTETIPFIKTE